MNKRDLSVSMAKANFYCLLIAVPLASLLGWLYFKIWGYANLIKIYLSFKNLLYLSIFFVIGTVVHELIHGLSWVIFGQKPLKFVKYGFQLKTLTPYAHCRKPMEANAYRIGVLMPGLLLGILPSLIGIATGNGWVMNFGILFTLAAGGDFLILWLIRNVSSSKLVEDHPTKAGCYVIDP